jgi:hypothetical protein
MKGLQKAVIDYISMRRALGYKLKDAARLLSDFVAFCKEQGAEHITIPLALQWAQRTPARPAEWARRLTCVRCFARYWRATCPVLESDRSTNANPTVEFASASPLPRPSVPIHG